MRHFWNGSVCLLVLLLSSGLRSCLCETDLVAATETSEDSGRHANRTRRTLRVQHSKAGPHFRNGTDSQEAELRSGTAAHTGSGRKEPQLQEISPLLNLSAEVLISDAPSSVAPAVRVAPDLSGHSSISSAKQLRIPKILHQLYFVSDSSKDYETGTVVDKQFPKKWQASCKAAFPEWEYRCENDSYLLAS